MDLNSFGNLAFASKSRFPGRLFGGQEVWKQHFSALPPPFTFVTPSSTMLPELWRFLVLLKKSVLGVMATEDQTPDLICTRQALYH